MGELWEQQPGANEFVAGVRKIDNKLADAILIALRAGHSLDDIKLLCRVGLITSKDQPHD